MWPELQCERELERILDVLVDEMDERYGADLNEIAKVESKMDDLRLRNDLMDCIKEIVRCKKICERIKAERLQEVEYNMQIAIKAPCIHFEVLRDGNKNPFA